MSGSAYEAESTLVRRLDNALGRLAVLAGVDSGDEAGDGVLVELRLGAAPTDEK